MLEHFFTTNICAEQFHIVHYDCTCMQAPLICEYQTANYTLTIEDTTDPELPPLTRESTYSGNNRSVMEMFTSGLQINHNYTLVLSVVEGELNTEVSIALNFSKSLYMWQFSEYINKIHKNLIIHLYNSITINIQSKYFSFLFGTTTIFRIHDTKEEECPALFYVPTTVNACMHDHYNMCEMSQLVLDDMAKGPELLQQLLHIGVQRIGHSPSLFTILYS